jgi:rhodanese-related sulfurtransferase
MVDMVDAPRIAVDDLRKRMESGEDFTIIDTRNPQAWAESDVMMPEAIRIPLDHLEESILKLPKNKPIVAYCT